MTPTRKLKSLYPPHVSLTGQKNIACKSHANLGVLLSLLTLQQRKITLLFLWEKSWFPVSLKNKEKSFLVLCKSWILSRLMYSICIFILMHHWSSHGKLGGTVWYRTSSSTWIFFEFPKEEYFASCTGIDSSTKFSVLSFSSADTCSEQAMITSL